MRNFINEARKVQLYSEQMVDSGMFDKRDIIEWEDVSDKTYTHATYYFEARMDEEDTYTDVIRGTTKKTRFESAQNTREDPQQDAPQEQRDDEDH